MRPPTRWTRGTPPPFGCPGAPGRFHGLRGPHRVVNAGGTIVNPNSGKCLDASGRGTANDTQLQTWDCYVGGTQSNQVWTIR
ncbi:hypothetical protein GCM10022255_077770 [Dactylosporangium darangshiense]|uniref:Ricin B lectin domain-containing protein n=1 Tax=Dactylosporangium darangshiense TaxID=579108 RepID=A0ABP8DKG9_9ACTN